MFGLFDFQPGEWHQDRRAAYSYLLGIYLGDGYVGTLRRTHSLVISCDARHRGLLAEAYCVVDEFTDRPPSLQWVGDTHAARIVSYGPFWPDLIPQHGPGRKHERSIRLAAWQKEIVAEHSKQLIRGLIHSDGSRCLNRFTVQLKQGPKEYAYPRYFFSNHSLDIRNIFTEACDRLNIRWSLSNWRNVSVSHRDSVALLDEFVGPKV